MNIVGTQKTANIFYSLLKCFDMTVIKPRKIERNYQMHYCELKDNKSNTVALIHNVYILVSLLANISLYFLSFSLWLSFFYHRESQVK